MKVVNFAASLALAAAACVGSGGYVATTAVYAEPAEYVYVTPVDRVVVVSRDVLVSHGWVVYRVERSGRGRVLWARRGHDETIRVFATSEGNRVALRSVHEVRAPDHRGHRGWERRTPPRDIMAAIDVRLRGR